MIKSREGGRWMYGGRRWRIRPGRRCYINRHFRFNFLHDKFKGKLSFEGWDTKYSEEEIVEVGDILALLSVYDLWKKYSG